MTCMLGPLADEPWTSTTLPFGAPSGAYARYASEAPSAALKWRGGGRSEKSTERKGESMLVIGGGRFGPPKTIAAANATIASETAPAYQRASGRSFIPGL